MLYCKHFISTLKLLLNLANESWVYNSWLLHLLPRNVLTWVSVGWIFFQKWFFARKQNQNTTLPPQEQSQTKQNKNPTNANGKQNHKTKWCGRQVIKIKKMGCHLPLRCAPRTTVVQYCLRFLKYIAWLKRLGKMLNAFIWPSLPFSPS